jgi:hypothetical protein
LIAIASDHIVAVATYKVALKRSSMTLGVGDHQAHASHGLPSPSATSHFLIVFVYLFKRSLGLMIAALGTLRLPLHNYIAIFRFICGHVHASSHVTMVVEACTLPA